MHLKKNYLINFMHFLKNYLINLMIIIELFD